MHTRRYRLQSCTWLFAAPRIREFHSYASVQRVSRRRSREPALLIHLRIAANTTRYGVTKYRLCGGKQRQRHRLIRGDRPDPRRRKMPADLRLFYVSNWLLFQTSEVRYSSLGRSRGVLKKTSIRLSAWPLDVAKPYNSILVITV